MASIFCKEPGCWSLRCVHRGMRSDFCHDHLERRRDAWWENASDAEIQRALDVLRGSGQPK